MGKRGGDSGEREDGLRAWGGRGGSEGNGKLCDTSKCDFRSDSVLCVSSPWLSVYPLKYNRITASEFCLSGVFG